MKTNILSFPSAAIFSLGATLFLTACSRDKGVDTAPSPTATIPASPVQDSMNSAAAAFAESWEDMKDHTFEQRSDFAAKTNAYAATLDRRIQNAGDEASGELAEARDELRAAANEVSNATSETWSDTKERVARAWNRAQTAHLAAE